MKGKLGSSLSRASDESGRSLASLVRGSGVLRGSLKEVSTVSSGVWKSDELVTGGSCRPASLANWGSPKNGREPASREGAGSVLNETGPNLTDSSPALPPRITKWKYSNRDQKNADRQAKKQSRECWFLADPFSISSDGVLPMDSRHVAAGAAGCGCGGGGGGGGGDGWAGVFLVNIAVDAFYSS
ncbi:hypothetical protein CRG98_038638 [Punica granatum]|uniref:Uncharacterized protein n=1 Tax=Punica granatum TaxID=22663 RepID=A0A2I0IBS3_PUNGR|nr:hypothetical protein CRG98_038638 [Punica granatum]